MNQESNHNPPWRRGFGALRNLWQRSRSPLPQPGFVFGRPLVLFQSDDWGRVGVRDMESFSLLQKAGISLGERPYDYYSLETAEDVEEIAKTFRRHRDSGGRHPCLGMNFVLANVDFEKVMAGGFKQAHLRPLSVGLPDHWSRPGLFDAYRDGISGGVFSPALHGTTHYCRRSVERHLQDPGPRGVLLRSMWQAGVPYIHWRMPWVGFEYSDTPGGREEFLDSPTQEQLVENAFQMFLQFFSTLPRSACAPGYRANQHTYNAWAAHGICVAQNGPGTSSLPHFSAGGNVQPLLHLYRTLDFEPAEEKSFSLDACLKKAEANLAHGAPVIVSVHSINFHSTLKDFRSRTLSVLDQFLSTLESRHPDLLYVRDEDIYDLVNQGSFHSGDAMARVEVKKQMFTAAGSRSDLRRVWL